MKYGRWVRLVTDSSLPLTSFTFSDKHGDDIELNISSNIEIEEDEEKKIVA
jgi:hypothetical protein